MNFETVFEQKQKQSKEELFLAEIEAYDAEQTSRMKAKGYTFKGYVAKTVSFTFGTITFKRKRWKRNDENCYPVDAYLGIKKRQRVSEGLLQEIAVNLPLMTFRGVTEIMNQRGIEISTWVVVQSRKLVSRLLKEREEYRFYSEEDSNEKINSPIIYVEADGLRIKTCSQKENRKNTDFSHYVIHTGKEKGKIQNFREFYSLKPVYAKQQLVDHIYNHYNVTSETLLYTRSDEGKGYTAHIFKEICKDIGILKSNHHHFWDRWHIFKYISDHTSRIAPEIKELFNQSIREQNRDKLHLALDTMESNIIFGTENQQEDFRIFKKRMLYNYKYSATSGQRALAYKDIPVIEANHKKITHRMKHRGMYWSLTGSLTMINIILMKKKNTLSDLFNGEWRQKYSKYKEYDDLYHSRNIMSRHRKQVRQARYVDKRHPSKNINKIK